MRGSPADAPETSPGWDGHRLRIRMLTVLAQLGRPSDTSATREVPESVPRMLAIPPMTNPRCWNHEHGRRRLHDSQG
jgi:hypothetical protein